MSVNSMETVHCGKHTKIDRYKWTVIDKPGSPQSINKSLISADRDYQRKISEGKVTRIAAEWSWIGCGALLVAYRPDSNEYFVMDGQHRLEAAKRRSDITSLPCMVFEIDDIKEESSGFYRANVERKPLTFSAKFNALLIAGDKSCIKAKRAVDAAGYSIVETSIADKTICCMAAVVNCINEDEEVFNRIWPVIVEVHKGKQIHKDILNGMFYVERRSNISLTEKSNRSKLARFSKDDILSEIRKAHLFFGRATPKVSAEGVLNLINKSRRIKISMEKSK